MLCQCPTLRQQILSWCLLRQVQREAFSRGSFQVIRRQSYRCKNFFEIGAVRRSNVENVIASCSGKPDSPRFRRCSDEVCEDG